MIELHDVGDLTSAGLGWRRADDDFTDWLARATRRSWRT